MPPGNRILLLTAPEERATFSSLEGDGLIVSYSDDLQVIETIPLEETPNLLLLDLSLVSPGSLGGFARRCKEADMPILALVPSDSQASVDPRLEVEDFVFLPFTDAELWARVQRALWRNGRSDSGQVIHAGDLIIDLERYEVSVGGRKVILTFKEYQLLRLLASNPGRVFTRETLLNRVWQYDYFGGTRTVDVHIRRLRSKVEDASHLFIETVRNVGYRFRVA